MGATQLFERREYKYLLPPEVIPQVRAAARSVCTLDRYAGDDGTYRIRSLYLDTPGRDLFWANEREQGQRFKARIRCYPGKTSPVFLEIKRREYDVIIKHRTAISQARWSQVRGNRWEDWAGIQGADEFIRLVYGHQLEPVTLVEYAREAYASQIDDYGRLTLDSYICCQPTHEWTLDANDKLWRLVDNPVRTSTPGPVCVLELKFGTHAPRWMVDLVQGLGLMRYSFSKYCYSAASQNTHDWVPEPVTGRVARRLSPLGKRRSISVPVEGGLWSPPPPNPTWFHRTAERLRAWGQRLGGDHHPEQPKGVRG